MHDDLIITHWDYNQLAPTQVLRSTIRLLEKDFGDVTESVARANITSLEKRVGTVQGHFEDWGGKGQFKLLVELNIDQAQVHVEMLDSSFN